MNREHSKVRQRRNEGSGTRALVRLAPPLFFLACVIPGCDLGAGNCNLWNNNPNACPAGAQTQSCPILMNLTGTVSVWECNIPPQYCNGGPGQNDGPLAGAGAGGSSVVSAGCGCVICQTSQQAALDDAQQILAMQSLSVDPSGPPLQCRGPLATLSAAYDTGPLFAVSECTQVGQATCRPCDDGAGGTLQSAGQHCFTDPSGGSNCCRGLACIDPSTGQPPPPNTGWEQASCQGTLATCPPPKPNWQPLDTATLRNICLNTNINGAASQSGIAFNRTCGVAFETWVLKSYGWLPRWTKSISSQARAKANQSKGGLPASVIPEKVLDQSSFNGWAAFPQSVFVEVKAVNGTLTLGTSQYQILGLLDAVNTWPAVPDAGAHAPPIVYFVTTSNTSISKSPQQVTDTATMWNVAVWQQKIYYDANGGTNPKLSAGDPANPKPECLNPAVYPTNMPVWPGLPPQNPLTWATIPEQHAVGAVVEPDPDSPALVP